MIHFKDISIRNKLILMQVITTLLVLAIVFSVFIITDIRGYKQRKQNNMISLAQVIGNNSISAIQFQDDEAANKILAELKTVSPDIINAVIRDSAGNVFAVYKRPGTDTIIIPSGLSTRKSVFKNDRLYVASNISDNGKVIGTVYLETDLAELAQIRKSKLSTAFLLLLAAIGCAFIIAFLVQGYTTGRLLRLADAMRDVGRTGDYNKQIADSGKDEIGKLITVFNNLLFQVKASQQRKDEFIGIASHELKTPLTSIKGYIELLNSIEDREPHKEYVRRALKNVNKLEKLIQDLLDVSRIQSGQLELNMHEFNVNKLIDETISSMQMVTETHEIVKENDIADLVITADRQRIEQVLTNLLSNAIKYSPGEQKVNVYCRKTDSEVIIRVRDYGMGVPEAERANIFERFYRTKDTSVTILGFGLGLYICKDIIRRHNGKIWVEPEDKGSAFYFSLPLNGKVEKK